MKEIEGYHFTLEESHQFGKIYTLLEKELMFIQYKANQLIDVKVAEEIIETTFNLIQKNKLRFLISDNRNLGIETTSEARELFSRNKAIDAIEAHVLLVKDLSVRILAHGYWKFNKPETTTAIMNKLPEAFEWLKKHGMKMT